MPALVAGTHAVERYSASERSDFYILIQGGDVTAWIPAIIPGQARGRA